MSNRRKIFPCGRTSAIALVGAPEFTYGCERAADLALTTGEVAVFVGLADGYATVCNDHNCCGEEPGAVWVVPDLLMLEIEANHPDHGMHLQTLRREDGRSVAVIKGPGRRSS